MAVSTPLVTALLSALPLAEAALNIAKAEWLTGYKEAKCLDGSPALYYIREATSETNRSKWVFHIQGGGWCSDMNSCYSRSLSRLGSSLRKYGNNDTIDLNNIQGCNNNRWCGALMVNNETMNPLAYDWNAVLLMYCDGASWIGNQADPVPYNASVSLHFRGWHNLNAVFDSLEEKYTLGDATQVLFGGDSAGGLATYYHTDWAAARIRSANARRKAAPTEFLSIPDSGYWPDDTEEGFSSTFTDMFKMQNGTVGLPQNCVDKLFPDNVTRCLFPQYFADGIQERLFPFQSLVDPLQKGKHPQTHALWLLERINATILNTDRGERGVNGGWLHSCERHCGAELLTIDGVQAPEAITAFLAGGARPEKRLWLQNKTYPCASCCNDGQ